MFCIDVYNIWAHNSNYNHFHDTMCHNSKAAPDGNFYIFYLKYISFTLMLHIWCFYSLLNA